MATPYPKTILVPPFTASSLHPHHDVASAQPAQYAYFFAPNTSVLYVNVEWFVSTLPNDEARRYFLHHAAPYFRQTAICRHYTSYATIVFPHHVYDTKRYVEEKTKDPIRVAQRFYAFNTGRVITADELSLFAAALPSSNPLPPINVLVGGK